MLDKYEQDPRITMIAGFNNEEITPGYHTIISLPPLSLSGDGPVGKGSLTNGTNIILF